MLEVVLTRPSIRLSKRAKVVIRAKRRHEFRPRILLEPVG
jgi:hypothetical protein